MQSEILAKFLRYDKWNTNFNFLRKLSLKRYKVLIIFIAKIKLET